MKMCLQEMILDPPVTIAIRDKESISRKFIFHVPALSHQQ